MNIVAQFKVNINIYIGIIFVILHKDNNNRCENRTKFKNVENCVLGGVLDELSTKNMLKTHENVSYTQSYPHYPQSLHKIMGKTYAENLFC